MDKRTPEVLIGERRIGDGQPVYVIAEAGVNHDGRLDDALRMVAVAAQAGADAVKFQVFRAEELTTAAAPAAEYQKKAGATNQRDMLRRLELADADFARLRDECHNIGIEFLATPFSIADLQRLIELDIQAVKIGSADLNNTPLLTAAAQTSLPLIVSTGAAMADEIDAAFRLLERLAAAGRLVLMHCVSRYPTPVEEANLAAIAALRAAYGVVVGFSDHTRSICIGGWAAAAGAKVLEKHFTLDRTRPGPDHAASLEPGELRSYIEHVRAAQAALGSGRLGMSAGESDVRAAARKSATAARDIAAGEVFSDNNLTLKRPGDGIPPGELAALLGRRAAAAIAADTTLTWDMVQ